MTFVGGHRTWADTSARDTAHRVIVSKLADNPERALVLQALAKAPAFTADNAPNPALVFTTYFSVCLPQKVLRRLRLSAKGEEEMYHFGSFSPTAYEDARPADEWIDSILASRSAIEAATSRSNRRLEGERLACSPSHEPEGIVSQAP